ncbi:hypothetical protein [Arthrobacter humicola]
MISRRCDLPVLFEHLPDVQRARRCPFLQLRVHQQVLALMADVEYLIEVAQHFACIGGPGGVASRGRADQAGASS